MIDNSTRLQRTFSWIAILLVVAFMRLWVIQPIARYMYGDGQPARSLSELRAYLFFGLLGFAAFSYALRWTGVFPKRVADQVNKIRLPGWRSYALLFCIWIVLALVLIALLSRFPSLFRDRQFTDMLANILPMILLLVTWVYFLVAMKFANSSTTRTDEEKKSST